MITTQQAQVTEFHRVYGCTIGVDLATAPSELVAMRVSLLREEWAEFREALLDREEPHPGERHAQELADLTYVTLGAAVTFGLTLAPRSFEPGLTLEVAVDDACASLMVRVSFLGWALERLHATLGTYATALGIDLDAAVTEVHRANMSKLGDDGHPVLRADGKVLKGPNYTPPNMAGALLGATA